VVFEVLSESTERVDRGEKRDAYLALPSLQAYVLISQDKVRVEYWYRAGESWEGRILTETGDVLELPSIGCSIPVGELYARVSL
jgi:Uma2 family endonuclease